MNKKTPNSLKTDSAKIKEQFNRLENIAAEFSEKIFMLKKDQENFARYMQDNKLMH